jgi:hypothetical protein
MPASFERAVFSDRFNVIVASDVCMKVFAHVYGYDSKPQNDFGAAANNAGVMSYVFKLVDSLGGTGELV